MKKMNVIIFAILSVTISLGCVKKRPDRCQQGACENDMFQSMDGKTFPVEILGVVAESKDSTSEKVIVDIKNKNNSNDPSMGEVGQIVRTESLLSLLPFSFDSTYL